MAGKVKVNGQTVTVLGTKVDPDADRVTCEGQAVYAQALHYILLNKPKGCLSAVSDPEGRPTVMEYLVGVPVRVNPVGRLDFNSEGVLLFTNDGELSMRLQSPDYHVEKTYHVKVRGTLTEGQIRQMRTGVVLDDGYKTRPAQVDRLKNESKHDWLVITLTEGKRRQIHRMVEALGQSVQKIQRVGYGGISFYGLRVGDARELRQQEVDMLRKAVGLAANSQAKSRGKWKVAREDTELNRRRLKKSREEKKENETSQG